MISRRILIFLVYALAVLVVAFGVLMGSYALAKGTGDEPFAVALWRTAMVCLMLVALDLILLVGVLGQNAISQPDEPEDRSDS